MTALPIAVNDTLTAQLVTLYAAANGDSNDEEIEILQETLEMVTELLGERASETFRQDAGLATRAAHGNSNDEEIDALYSAINGGLELLGVPQSVLSELQEEGYRVSEEDEE